MTSRFHFHKPKPGFGATFLIKPFAPRPEDLAWLSEHEVVPEPDVSNTADLLRDELITKSREKRLVRLQNQCFGPHDTVPGALKSLGSLADFINETLAHSALFKTKGTLLMLLPWAESTQHPDWPLLTEKDFNPHVALFRDGWLDMATVTFMAHDPPRSLIVWDQTYRDIEAQPTPLWDGLILTQIRNELVKITAA